MKPVTATLRGASIPAPSKPEEPTTLVETPQLQADASGNNFDAVFPGETSSGESKPESRGSVEIVKAAPVTPAAANPYAEISDGALEGQWSASDLRLPTITIVAGNGELTSRFNAGTVIMGDDELLPPPKVSKPDPESFFRFIPLGMTKRWRQNLTQEQLKAGERPMYFDTKEEVEAYGGTVAWIGNQKPSFGAAAVCRLLVERPATGPGAAHPGFAYDVEGIANPLCAAVYYCHGQAFKFFAQLIFSAAATSLTELDVDPETKAPRKNPAGHMVRKTVLHKNWWRFRTTVTKAGEFSVIVPEIRLLPEVTSPAVRDLIAQLTGPAEA